MKLVSFLIDKETGYGAARDGEIVRFDTVTEVPPDLKSFLESGLDAADIASRAGDQVRLEGVTLLPPVPNPGKVLCVATNFLEPTNADKPVPEYPLVFTRFGDSFVGDRDILSKPSFSDMYDFEGELAVVIGKRAHKISADDALSHIAGYSCLNDGSVRDWQRHSTQFTPGKNFYRSGAFGPWLVTADEIPDPKALQLQTRVNGEVKQAIGMERMIFDIPWLISYFSTFTPLCPGDVIATGTPSGFGSSRKPPEFLRSGDRVEVEITQVGTLRNTVMEQAE